MNYSITGLLYDILFIVVLMLAASSGWRRGFVSSLMLLIGGVAGIFGAVFVSRTAGPLIYNDYVAPSLRKRSRPLWPKAAAMSRRQYRH